MTYKINGTAISTQPTTGQWMPRESLGYDGNGHPIYPGVRQFELNWDIIDPLTVDQLQDWYVGAGNTGTVVADLPYFMSGSYTFFPYSGCVINEPSLGQHFTEHYTQVTLLLTNIRT